MGRRTLQSETNRFVDGQLVATMHQSEAWVPDVPCSVAAGGPKRASQASETGGRGPKKICSFPPPARCGRHWPMPAAAIDCGGLVLDARHTPPID